MIFFEGVLYFGWPNQPSSGTMKILHWAAEHFLSSPNHTANDMQLIPTEKIFSVGKNNLFFFSPGKIF